MIATLATWLAELEFFAQPNSTIGEKTQVTAELVLVLTEQIALNFSMQLYVKTTLVQMDRHLKMP